MPCSLIVITSKSLMQAGCDYRKLKLPPVFPKNNFFIIYVRNSAVKEGNKDYY